MKSTKYPKQNIYTEFVGSSWTGLQQGYSSDLSSITQYVDGKYTITRPGEQKLVFTRTSGASATGLKEGVDYSYDKRLDKSASEDPTDGFGTIAGGIMDVSLSGNLDTNRAFRITRNGYNLTDEFQPSGEVKVYAKEFTKDYTPPPDSAYLDPKTGRIILHRPTYMNRCSSVGNMDYPEIVSHLTPTSTLSSATTTTGGIAGGTSYYHIRVANQGGSDITYIYPYTGNTMADDYVVSFWAYGHTWNREKDNNTYYAAITSFFLNDNTYAAYGSVPSGADETWREYVYINGTAYVDTSTSAAWRHIVIGSNGTTTKFYINGSLVATSNASISKSNPYFRMYSATVDAGSHDGYGYCMLDNIKIWENNYQFLDAIIAMEYNSGSGTETALHPMYGQSNGYIPVVQAGYKYIPSGNTPAVLPKPTGSNQQIPLEDVSDYANGLGYFGKGHSISKANYTPPVANTDFYYDEAIDGSGAHAKDIYDDSISGSFASGKIIRIVNDGKNLTDATGLNLVPVAKSMVNDYYSPPATQFYIDPVRGKIVLPRPVLFTKCISDSLIAIPEIGDWTWEDDSSGTVTEYSASTYGVYNSKWNSENFTYYRIGGASATGQALKYIKANNTNYSKGTVSLWYGVICDYSDGNSQHIIYISDTTYVTLNKAGNNGIYSFRIYVNGVAQGTLTSLAYDREWHHAYITWDVDTGINLWIDGVSKASYSGAFSITSGHIFKIRFEAHDYASSGTAVMLLHNLKVWNICNTDYTMEYYAGAGRRDALHWVYGATNDYSPVLTSSGGVGYYKASSAGALVRGTI